MFKWIIKYFFPYRLKVLREKQGKNQDYLARFLEVNQRTISNWEQAKAQPSLNKLINLAFELNVDMNYLLCLDLETYAILCDAVAKNLDLCPSNKFEIKYLQELIKDIPFKGEYPFTPDYPFMYLVQKLQNNKSSE